MNIYRLWCVMIIFNSGALCAASQHADGMIACPGRGSLLSPTLAKLQMNFPTGLSNTLVQVRKLFSQWRSTAPLHSIAQPCAAPRSPPTGWRAEVWVSTVHGLALRPCVLFCICTFWMIIKPQALERRIADTVDCCKVLAWSRRQLRIIGDQSSGNIKIIQDL